MQRFHVMKSIFRFSSDKTVFASASSSETCFSRPSPLSTPISVTSVSLDGETLAAKSASSQKPSKRARFKEILRRLFRRDRRTYANCPSVDSFSSVVSTEPICAVPARQVSCYRAVPRTRLPRLYAYRLPTLRIAFNPLRPVKFPGVSEYTLNACFTSPIWTTSPDSKVPLSPFKRNPLRITISQPPSGDVTTPKPNGLVYSPYHDFFVRLNWLFETWRRQCQTSPLSLPQTVCSPLVTVVVFPKSAFSPNGAFCPDAVCATESPRIETLEHDSNAKLEECHPRLSALEAHLAQALPDDASFRRLEKMGLDVVHLHETRKPVAAKSKKVSFSGTNAVVEFSADDAPSVISDSSIGLPGFLPKSALRVPAAFPLLKAASVPQPEVAPYDFAAEFNELAHQVEQLDLHEPGYKQQRRAICRRFKAFFHSVASGPHTSVHRLLASQANSLVHARKCFAATAAVSRGLAVQGTHDITTVRTLCQNHNFTAEFLVDLESGIDDHLAELGPQLASLQALRPSLEGWYMSFFETHCRARFAPTDADEAHFHERIGFAQYRQRCFMVDTELGTWEQYLRHHLGVLSEAAGYNAESLRMMLCVE
ncbi:hypothetical protein CA3LBN_003134 [Candidozyma haemuli]|uniref:Uncharacterized protein n=2 Tax=Candidozyma TaxID=3303203 RepID=A0ABX8IDL1_9ASCO|nr:hypothetical protein CA3LBN_003134 [[Candida] haemuloni]